MKMSKFENPTWWTAAILKIIISPYFSRKSSEFHKILYADTNFLPGDRNMTKNQKFPKFKMADGRHIENHFFGYNSAPLCPIKTKFGVPRCDHTHMKVM